MTKAAMRLAVCIALIATAGCTTSPISSKAAKPVPKDRMFALNTPGPGLVKMTVTRDSGLLGSGCYVGLALAGQFVARFDPEESADFYVTPGPVQMSAVPDPEGKALCAAGWDPVIEKYLVTAEGSNLYRISLGMYRRPRVIPAPY